jgi:hypothetical protein
MNIVIKKSDLISVEISSEICEIKTVFNGIILKAKHDVVFSDNFADALNQKFDFCDIHYVGSTVFITPKYAGYYAYVRKYNYDSIYEFGFMQDMITIEEED